MLIDIHVHTKLHSPCSLIDPYSLVKRVKYLPIDGIVITEHDYVWNQKEREELRAYCPDVFILFGMELNCKRSLHYLIYYDLSITDINLYEYMNEEDMYKEVNRCGGVIVAAHMLRYGRRVNVSDVARMQVNGLEVKSTNITDEEMSLTLKFANTLNLCTTAGSDAHQIDDVGRFYTSFDFDINNEADLVRAIKAKACRAVIL
ncbi:MAG: PHP domain-containing protein [Nitrospirae bacterium]|nr:PHP domain-containing protein [Nitrospirota bacterium]